MATTTEIYDELCRGQREWGDAPTDARCENCNAWAEALTEGLCAPCFAHSFICSGCRKRGVTERASQYGPWRMPVPFEKGECCCS